MNDKMVTATILDHASMILDRYGWVRGRHGTYEEGFCTVGAISTACQEMHVRVQEYESSFLAVDEFLGTNQIEYWNDEAGRTREEVINVLRTCAEKLRIEASEKAQ